jgi:hypothetical protein
MKIDQKNKKIILFALSIIFFIDFIFFFISALADQKQSIEDKGIIIGDFLIIFGFFFLGWIYLLMLNLSETFQNKIFKIASILIKDKERMHKNLDWSLMIGTVIFGLIIISIFYLSVLPEIYNFLLEN